VNRRERHRKEVDGAPLHDAGPRRSGPFVAVNWPPSPRRSSRARSSARPRRLHDARAPRTGLFLQAHGGTLLLDEIGEMADALQPKLPARASRSAPCGRSAATPRCPFDVHILATTNRDLRALIDAGRFPRTSTSASTSSTSSCRRYAREAATCWSWPAFRLSNTRRRRQAREGARAGRRRAALVYPWPATSASCRTRSSAPCAHAQHRDPGRGPAQTVRAFTRSHVLWPQRPVGAGSAGGGRATLRLRVVEAAGGKQVARGAESWASPEEPSTGSSKNTATGRHE